MKKRIKWLSLLSIIFILCIQSIQITYAEDSSSPSLELSPIDIFDIERNIKNHTAQSILSSTIGASIVVVKEDDNLHERGYGYTDKSFKQEVKANSTMFEWGSISKLFVWVSALQLVEQGKLDLDSPISNYLSKEDMPKLNYDEPITMLHLMNHTAGFEEYYWRDTVPTIDQLMPLKQALKAAQPYQAYEPGTLISYSNYGSALAAYIIETITEQSYEDYVKENILVPLDMHDTLVTVRTEQDVQKVNDYQAKGYYSPMYRQFEEASPNFITIYPCGDFTGPATDLAKFANALLAKTEENNVLFSDLSTLELLFTTTYRPAPHIAGIAHGFWEGDYEYKSYSHGGNTFGYSAMMHLVPSENLAIIVLTNQDSEYTLTHKLIKSILHPDSSKLLTQQHETLPLKNAIDYNQYFINSRSTNHTFTKMNVYFNALKIEADYEKNQLQMHHNGIIDYYEQIAPDTFQLVQGSHFSPQQFYLKIKDNKISYIYFIDEKTTTIPTILSPTFTIISIILTILVVIFMLIQAIYLIINRKKQHAPYTLYALVLITQFISAINTAILAYRVYSQVSNTLDQLMIHFMLNYGLLLITVVIIVSMSIKAFQLKLMYRNSYIFTIVSVICYQLFLILWRVFTF